MFDDGHNLKAAVQGSESNRQHTSRATNRVACHVRLTIVTMIAIVNRAGQLDEPGGPHAPGRPPPQSPPKISFPGSAIPEASRCFHPGH